MPNHSPLPLALVFLACSILSAQLQAVELSLNLRFQRQESVDNPQFQTLNRQEKWTPTETAIVVCDAWDLHHCLNAVERLEQFAPRLNQVLNAARRQGVTIIHSPSDCMPHYEEHAARKRAQAVPVAKRVPHNVATWCSVVPAEERGIWPIDQSDGGEDDDPEEHAEWVAKLKAMGRNPGTPWIKQSDLSDIAATEDFISDRGDEVWNILEAHGIRNVILTGVHTNMCVIGRPFGLRQMARNGKNVVLMRDMTDTMYNPKQWPYVSHFAGTKLIIAHIERFVCPTITSDQIIGGEPFRFAGDKGDKAMSDFAMKYLRGESISKDWLFLQNVTKTWTPIQVPSAWEDSNEVLLDYDGVGWYRCAVRVPSSWLDDKQLTFDADSKDDTIAGWFNGHPMLSGGPIPGNQVVTLSIDPAHVNADDANLFVIRIQDRGGKGGLRVAPVMRSETETLKLAGRWQFRIGDDASFSNIPLPAKFGTSADIVFSPPEPLWQARPLTQIGEFTSGIEGPACDPDGNVFAVNFGRQGTIGRISPNGIGEVFVDLPAGSIGNGIRFHSSGKSFYVADYTQHNVLRVDVDTRKVSMLGHSDAMNQPNDLAIAPDGTIFASDPNWKDNTGQIWRIDSNGESTRLANDMGTTNGIEVSPDGTQLYVNESVQRNIWVFDITAKQQLANKRIFKTFGDFGFDGMRCDVDGNLYVTRYGKGTVVKLSSDGEVLQEIDVLGAKPSNLCFGGNDGCTVYVTEVENQRIVSFRADRPGRSWQAVELK